MTTMPFLVSQAECGHLLQSGGERLIGRIHQQSEARTQTHRATLSKELETHQPGNAADLASFGQLRQVYTSPFFRVKEEIGGY
jgi:hypothetical protein